MNHFDSLPNYDAEIPNHVARYLVWKKSEKMRQHLRELPDNANLKGLDLGSGTGHHVRYLERSLESASIVGVDYSFKQLQSAKRNYPESSFVLGDMSALQFPDQTFDFVYLINSLHHLSSKEMQHRTLAEIIRVTKVNGIIFIHEINLRNPLFKFYMKTIFPKLRKIDTGNEIFIDEHLLRSVEYLEWIKTDYFTFIPDFCPHFLLPLLKPIDKILDSSPLSHLGAHFMVASRRIR